MITYRQNHEKILEGLLWIATQAPELDHYWVVKIMFGADKLHVNRYGRPVFGDTYVAMKYGPVPSHALDIINRRLCPESGLPLGAESLHVEPSGMGLRIVPQRPPHEDVFSGTDLECLRESLTKYRRYSFGQLVEETHAEPAWVQAWESRGDKGSKPMDYLSLLEDSPDKAAMAKYMRETAGSAVF
jgi:uncharacterized phage-associated protein